MEPISALVSAVAAAREVTSAALAVRDFNASATALARVNEQLLDVLDKALETKAYAITLQQQLFEANQELRLLQQSQDERDDYDLFAVFPGVFAYRYRPASEGDSLRRHPAHFLCQPCFDKGTKSVLQQRHAGAYLCPACQLLLLQQSDDAGPHFAIGHDDDPLDRDWP